MRELSQFVSEFGEEIFSIDDHILFCVVCEIKVLANKQQHIGRDKLVGLLDI